MKQNSQKPNPTRKKSTKSARKHDTTKVISIGVLSLLGCFILFEQIVKNSTSETYPKPATNDKNQTTGMIRHSIDNPEDPSDYSENISLSKPDTAKPDPKLIEVVANRSVKKAISNTNLWSAFEDAKHRIQKVTPQEQQIPGNEGVKYFASQPNQQMTARFSDNHVRLLPGLPDMEWSLDLKVTGRISQNGNHQIDYQNGNVIQWFHNGKEGLEHGFTVLREPEKPKSNGEWASIEVESAGMTARFDPKNDGDLIFKKTEESKTYLAYRNLKVWDAKGRDLAAKMEPTDNGFRISYDGNSAVYPVTIDPTFEHVAYFFSKNITQNGVFYGQEDGNPDSFGSSVALNENWAFIGNPNDDDLSGIDIGAVYVFKRNKTHWEFSDRIKASDASYQSRFGSDIDCTDDQLFISANRTNNIYRYNLNPEGTWVENEILISTGNWAYYGDVMVAKDEQILLTAETRVGYTSSRNRTIVLWLKTNETWEEHILPAPADADLAYWQGDDFGSDLAIGPDGYLFVAARFQSGTNSSGATVSNVGAAYIYHIDDLTNGPIQKLTPETSYITTNYRFGEAIEVDSSGFAYIGAQGHTRADANASGTQHGIVYQLQFISDEWQIVDTIMPQTAYDMDRFGGSIAVSTTHLFIGARDGGQNIPNDDRVAVYLNDKGILEKQAEVVSASENQYYGDSFGSEIAASGNYLLVGISGRHQDRSTQIRSGEAEFFFFDGNNWVNSQLIQPLDGGAGDFYGRQVALANNLAVISEPSAATAAGNMAGQVWILAQTNGIWSLEAQFQSAQHPSYENDPYFFYLYSQFGSQIALHGDFLAVASSPNQPVVGGKVVLYKRDKGNWRVVSEVTRDDSDGEDGFGTSLSIQDTLLAVGAPADRNGKNERVGSVFIYEIKDNQNRVNLIDIVRRDERQEAEGDEFGESVALWNGHVLVGAPKVNSPAGADTGIAFLMDIQTFSPDPIQTLYPSDGQANDEFGAIVDASMLDEGTFLVGAARKQTNPGDGGRGVAYIFKHNNGFTTEIASLKKSTIDGNSTTHFSASLWNNRVALGYARHPRLQNVPGSVSSGLPGIVFVFEGSGTDWSLVRSIDYPGIKNEAYFGYSLDLYENELLVGAALDSALLPNGDAVNSGSVFHYFLDTPRNLYDQWASSRGLTGSDSYPEAAPFGTKNLVDYAFYLEKSTYDTGFNILADNTTPHYQVKLVKSDNSGQLTYHVDFLYRKHAGLTYTPQYNTTLEPDSWQSFTSAAEETYYNYNFNHLSYREIVPNSNQPYFVRVKVAFTE